MENPVLPRISAFNCPNCVATVSPDDMICAYCGSSLATRICGACFGAVGVGKKHCSHCGASVQEAQSVKPEKTLKCPCCKVVMELQKIGGQFIYICPQCGGMWLNQQGFQNICDSVEEQEAVVCHAAPAVTPQIMGKRRQNYIPCPECGKLMNQKNFAGCSGVVLDLCRDHGCWFDRQELHSIVKFIREGGIRRSMQKEIRDLKEHLEVQRRQAVPDMYMNMESNHYRKRMPGTYLESNRHRNQEPDIISTFAKWLRN